MSLVRLLVLPARLLVLLARLLVSLVRMPVSLARLLVSLMRLLVLLMSLRLLSTRGPSLAWYPLRMSADGWPHSLCSSTMPRISRRGDRVERQD